MEHEIAEAWQSFPKPVGASDEQIELMRKSFYSGAYRTFQIVMDATAEKRFDDTARRLEALEVELELFAADVITSAGRRRS